mmetsp:Transcript_15401/g.31659  ORF Transcript_15401/g.31659 Transcript_15401/m.31659 type:complete len:245 (+) Transcript_15401:112-846(+)
MIKRCCSSLLVGFSVLARLDALAPPAASRRDGPQRTLVWGAKNSYGFSEWRSVDRNTDRGTEPTQQLESAATPLSTAELAELDRDLTALQRQVLRLKHTEPLNWSTSAPVGLDESLRAAFGTVYPQEGAYRCCACAAPLYWARTKMSCGCGWPAFWDSVEGAVVERPDVHRDGFAPRATDTEIACTACGGHLGHVFRGEQWGTPTDARHCVNGVVLVYDPAVAGQPGDLKRVAHLTQEGVPGEI